ncbi:MAG: DUF87 domain-containing protein [Cyanobacteriota bacterium]
MRDTDDLLRKLTPTLRARVKSLWHLGVLSKDPKREHENKQLLRLLADRYSKIDYQDEIRLPPPSREELSGEYNLGEVIYPDSIYGSFGLREEDFPRHILICGMTGTGKTNICYHILRQLAHHNKPFWIFDWKGSYKKLRQLPEFDSLQVIRIGDPECNFKFNPLIPPRGVDPKHWMALLIDVIKHSFFVAHGPEFFLRKGIDEVYKRFKVYEGSETFPTFTDLEKLLRKEYVKGREMLWMSSTKRVLAALTFSGLLGEVLDVRSQPEIERLLDGQVIFELDNLATLEKTFFVEALLLWLFHYRKRQGAAGFRHAVVIEEAHHVLSAKKERLVGEEPIIESFVRMIREFGESVIAVDQEPSKLSKSILANTGCKVCFTLGSGEDILVMGRAMNLGIDGAGWLEQLRVGSAVMKLVGRFWQPIHVKVPLVRLS